MLAFKNMYANAKNRNEFRLYKFMYFVCLINIVGHLHCESQDLKN